MYEQEVKWKNRIENYTHVKILAANYSGLQSKLSSTFVVGGQYLLYDSVI